MELHISQFTNKVIVCVTPTLISTICNYPFFLKGDFLRGFPFLYVLAEEILPLL